MLIPIIIAVVVTLDSSNAGYCHFVTVSKSEERCRILRLGTLM